MINTFKQAYIRFWTGYINFNERTECKDFWYATLINAIISLVLSLIAVVFGLLGNQVLPDGWTVLSEIFNNLGDLYAFLILIPSLAILVRRLRDGGFHWSLSFLLFIPFAGLVAIIVLTALPSSEQAKEIKEHQTAKEIKIRINETGQKISFWQAQKNFFKGYFDFSGQTNVGSYWWVQLIYGAVIIVLMIFLALSRFIEGLLFGGRPLGSLLVLVLLIVFILGAFVPQLAQHFRRWRQVGLTEFASLLLIALLTLALLLKSAINHVNQASYGIHNFTLANFLVFLILFVLVITIILIGILPKDELAKDKATLLFRKKD